MPLVQNPTFHFSENLNILLMKSIWEVREYHAAEMETSVIIITHESVWFLGWHAFVFFFVLRGTGLMK